MKLIKYTLAIKIDENSVNLHHLHHNWSQENLPTHTSFFHEAIKDPELHEGISLETKNQDSFRSREYNFLQKDKIDLGMEDHNLHGKLRSFS